MIGSMSIAQLQNELLTDQVLLSSGESTPFSHVSIDSRKVQPGDMFIALHGANFNGHDYLDQARQAGAVCALVEAINSAEALPQLQVDSTELGLGAIARLNRKRFNHPLIAITGSSGKTTVRAMTDAILACEGKVLSTEGNLNNQIGVPLTLLRLDGSEQFAIIEMGASAGGDIAYLCDLAIPDVVLINNVMPAHLEGFGSIEGVAEAKGEIYQGVNPDGCCVVNIDDKFSGQWLREIHSRSQLTFALHNSAAQCFAQNIRQTHSGVAFDLCLLGRALPVNLPVQGLHNVRNALAAACCAYAVGASDGAIVEGLQAFSGVPGRMKFIRSARGAMVIDDSYNANPGSVKAAIDVLADIPGQRILVMGDMGELGEEAHLLHAEIGNYAGDKNIDAVFTLGCLAQAISDNFTGTAQHFTQQAALIAHLQNLIDDSGNTILIKGSRSAHMDNVVRALTHEESK